jgi:shikimate dehydrogenase
MKRFGLIGHPIAHSLSPALFKAGYGGKYPYELIDTADFEEAYNRFLNGYDGINVTAPFKELAYAKADILSEECRIIKATNLLVRTPEGVKAYNSDYLGVRMWLQEAAEGLKRTPPQPHSTARVLIIGTGGAGKAAAVAAASLGMDLILINRSIEKAEAVAGSIAEMNEDIVVEVHPMEDFRCCFRKADIVIYNIPSAIPALGELTSEDFNPGHQKFILEANYRNPSFDDTLIGKMNASNPAASYTDGKVWLLYQALTGYEIFTGEKPDLGSMSAVL